jgi:hypothetical protein
MYKFIFDNTKNKNLKDLSLIPGFNLDNNTQKKIKITESEKIIDDNTFTKFFNLINESTSIKNKLTRKNKTKNNKTKKI